MNEPAHFGDIVYGNKSGGDNVRGDKYEFRGGPHPPWLPDPTGKASARRVILVLSANPRLTSPLHIGEEKRAIDRPSIWPGRGTVWRPEVRIRSASPTCSRH